MNATTARRPQRADYETRPELAARFGVESAPAVSWLSSPRRVPARLEGREPPVALYEIVLRFPDRDEIRITDRNGYHDGQEVVIAGRRFLVTGSERPRAAIAAGRFVLEPHGWSPGRRQATR